jgi:8-oxo-dGTP pyrophosphatase MutT (NUDIX family)
MKACAVVLHPDGAPARLLAFEHPKAGLQLVKGGIEPGETPQYAAMRELYEEAGLESTAALPLCIDEIDGVLWHFVLCRAKPPVHERWQHLCKDDGGLLFRFFWQQIDEAHQFEGPFEQAWSTICAALR